MAATAFVTWRFACRRTRCTAAQFVDGQPVTSARTLAQSQEAAFAELAAAGWQAAGRGQLCPQHRRPVSLAKPEPAVVVPLATPGQVGVQEKPRSEPAHTRHGTGEGSSRPGGSDGRVAAAPGLATMPGSPGRPGPALSKYLPPLRLMAGVPARTGDLAEGNSLIAVAVPGRAISPPARPGTLTRLIRDVAAWRWWPWRRRKGKHAAEFESHPATIGTLPGHRRSA